LQPDALLELDRAHRGHGLEAAEERRHAHTGQGRAVLHTERLGVVLPDPADGARHVREAAVDQPELAHRCALLARDQVPEDLAPPAVPIPAMTTRMVTVTVTLDGSRQKMRNRVIWN